MERLKPGTNSSAFTILLTSSTRPLPSTVDISVLEAEDLDPRGWKDPHMSHAPIALTL